MPPSRIDELRRRVQNDPASIAFAQLAEEYRRSGQTDEAVRICREGLTRHPGYLSARVTLGRALLDLGQLAEARGEFEFVVAEAPENLAAVRGLAEIFHRDGVTDEALNYYRRALALARHDPEIEEIVQQLSRQVGAAAAEPNGSLSYEEAHLELQSAAERVPLATPTPASASTSRNTSAEGATAPFDFDRLVAALGTPAAPPQVEAVVEGRPVPVIELPDPIDLGPNPFAALEAELRAHDVVADPSAALVWPPAMPADDPATDVHVLYADDATVTEPSTAAAAEVVVLTQPDASPEHDIAHGEAMFSGLAAFEPEGVPPPSAAAADTQTPPTKTPVAGEDVLGDIESWLNTLHDRSTD